MEAEATLAALLARGLRPTDDPREADVLVVHTCAFVEDARKESVDVLLELAASAKAPASAKAAADGSAAGAARPRGRRRPRLVAVGCLPQRYGEDLLRMLPEVDAVVGCNDLARVADVALGTERVLLSARPGAEELEPLASRASQLRHVRYLKVAEGCSRRCAFCAIPAIRGPARSRPPATLLEEARRMAGDGAVELVLVAQDVSRYGADRLGDRAGPPLLRLLERLGRLPELRRLRLLYLYPEVLDAGFLRGLRGLPKVVPYFDVPLQHVTDAMLRRMRRGTRRRDIDALLERIRATFVEPTIRSTFIVGHPGEGAADFRELLRFVRTAGLDRIGLFRYSDEEGTAAFGMGDKVSRGVGWARFRALRAAARAAMRERQRALRGRVVEVLVDGPAPESEWLRVGRTAAQAPEIDGVTYLTGGLPPPGKFVAARITRTSESDLVADLRVGAVE
ncbi:MAG: MiaB/RimO family radical SAM methylthiotransferase [Deltaproteobacteria bacterium]|nr:MiaB/RimO family radical SAM methylthiotransferase [Deltaproteobacteria bacterium]